MGVEETLIICVTVIVLAVIVAWFAKRAVVEAAQVDAEKKLRTYELNNQYKLDKARIEAAALRGIPDESEEDDIVSLLKQWLPLIMPYLTPEGRKAATALAGGMTDLPSFLAALSANSSGNKGASIPETE